MIQRRSNELYKQENNFGRESNLYNSVTDRSCEKMERKYLKEMPVLGVVPKSCPRRLVPLCSCWPLFPHYRNDVPANTGGFVSNDLSSSNIYSVFNISSVKMR